MITGIFAGPTKANPGEDAFRYYGELDDYSQYIIGADDVYMEINGTRLWPLVNFPPFGHDAGLPNWYAPI